MGKKFSWLFEVPCKHWHKKELVQEKICPTCPIKELCDEHSEEIQRFIDEHHVDVYLSSDFIQLVHKT